MNNFGERMKKINLNFYKYILFYFILTFFAYSQEKVIDEIKIESKDETPLVSIHAEDTHLPTILAILANERLETTCFNIASGVFFFIISVSVNPGAILFTLI